MRIESIAIDKIDATSGTQMRAKIDREHIARCKEGIDSLPPIVVFHDGFNHYLADGFHRIIAHVESGRDTITCEVHEGTHRDAVIFAVGANYKHGLPRTNDDKRLCVKRLLEDPEWSQMSSRLIATKCHVSDHFVESLRKPTAHGAQLKTEPVLDAQPSGGEVHVPSPSPPPETPPVRIGADNRKRAVKPKIVTDKLGKEVLDPEMQQVFAKANELKGLAKMLHQVEKQLEDRIDAGDEAYAGLPWQRIKSSLVNARHAISASMPHAICPYCSGNGRELKNCKACKDRGWLPKATYEETVPKDLKGES